MKKGLKKILPGTGAVLLLLAGGVMAGAAGKEQEYIFPEVDKELLTEEDVKDLSSWPTAAMRSWQNMANCLNRRN